MAAGAGHEGVLRHVGINEATIRQYVWHQASRSRVNRQLDIVRRPPCKGDSSFQPISALSTAQDPPCKLWFSAEWDGPASSFHPAWGNGKTWSNECAVQSTFLPGIRDLLLSLYPPM